MKLITALSTAAILALTVVPAANAQGIAGAAGAAGGGGDRWPVCGPEGWRPYHALRSSWRLRIIENSSAKVSCSATIFSASPDSLL